jgi:hypothetical protein
MTLLVRAVSVEDVISLVAVVAVVLAVLVVLVLVLVLVEVEVGSECRVVGGGVGSPVRVRALVGG